MLAGVRSDGGHAMQENPAAGPCSGFVVTWPTIVFPRDKQSYWSYCQGLALMDRVSPWACCLDALELYGPYQLIVEVPIDISQIPSTVEIEELESDEEVDAAFEYVPNFGIQEVVYEF